MSNLSYASFQVLAFKCALLRDKHIHVVEGIVFLYIALDTALFSTKKYLYFSYFSTKTYVVGTH